MRYWTISAAALAVLAVVSVAFAHESGQRSDQPMMDQCMSMMGQMSGGSMMGNMGMMMGQRGMRGNDQVAQANTLHKGTGKINKVDSEKGVVNLSHGPIKSIGWPSMRMDFAVSDPSLLRGLDTGQEVEFEFRQDAGNKYVITRIEKKS